VRALRDQENIGHLDLEALEPALRSSMHQIGGVLLEKLLNSDGGGYRGTKIPCSQGHGAEFVEYRCKEVRTVLSVQNTWRRFGATTSSSERLCGSSTSNPTVSASANRRSTS